jgi:hypothetical protein
MYSRKQNSEYIKTVPFIASLETIRISIRVFASNDRSLIESMAAHAHCVTRQLWALYADQPSSSNLRAFNLEFWRWRTPSPHLDENGSPHYNFLDKVEFESAKRGSQLVVKAWDHRRTITTFYDQFWQDAHGIVVEGPPVIFKAKRTVQRERCCD